jgi:hypothetical protein
VDAAEHDDVGLGLGRGLRELQRVSDEVRQVLDLGLLVVVREDHGIALGLELLDPLLELVGSEIENFWFRRRADDRQLVHA